MNKNKKICICLCHHNSSEYLDDLIQSILKQSYKNWFLYIYDDGSNEYHKNQLTSKLMSLKNKHEIIYGDHIGLYSARLVLYKHCSGDIIITIDSDDMFLKTDFFSELNRLFQNKTDLVIFNLTRNETTLKKIYNFDSLDGITNKEALLYEIRKIFLCNGSEWNSLVTKAFSSKILNNIKNFKKMLTASEDRLTSISILDNVKICKVVPEVYYYYRPNPCSFIHSKITIEQISNKLFVEATAYNYAKKWKIKEYSYERRILSVLSWAITGYWSNNKSFRYWKTYARTINEFNEFNTLKIQHIKTTFPVYLFLNKRYNSCAIYCIIYNFIYRLLRRLYHTIKHISS